MKVARFILKLVAAGLALAAAACCVIAFWDKLEEAVDCARGKLRKGGCGGGEYNDYADWEAE